MADDPELQKRLNAFQDGKRGKRGNRLGLGALAVVLSLGGAGVAYWLANNVNEGAVPLETSDVEPFQDGRPGGGRLEFPPDETTDRVSDALIAVEEALDVPSPPSAPAAPSSPSAEVLAELARLREALSASQVARNAEIKAAVGDLREAFEAQTNALQDAVAERDARLQSLEQQSAARLSSLQSFLDAERAQREGLEAELHNNAFIADQRLLEERRRQEEAERQREAEREAEELLRAQVTSPTIVYSAGSRTPNAGATPPAGTYSAGAPPLDGNEAYLLTAARPLEVAEASRIVYPDRTLAQGSVIQAALQTAINSDLPGNVVAVVSEPLPAFSGDRILIPRGSRLFGQYRSGVEVNQKRILILWTRILTPDGASMDIAAVGGDQLGRSGLTGLVDTKFDERFGGAALISVIGAAPSVAARQAEGGVTSDVLENVGSDLSDATSSVIADQVSIAPTIYVDQGASVTVLVDRDIVIY